MDEANVSGIDLTKVYNSAAPAIVRLTALRLSQAESYTMPGDWVKSLPSLDLEYLLAMLNNVTDDEDNEYTEAFVLLALILAQAEGIDISDSLAAQRHANALSMFVLLESLNRKGVADVVHMNMSFGEDALSLPLAKGKVQT